MSEAPYHDPVETSFHVRFAETDAMGIVHHSTYLVWFEEGRSAFMRAHETSYTAFAADGVDLAVTQVQVRYIAPARYDQRVTVRCWIEQMRSRKMRFGYIIFDPETNQTLVTGITDHLCVTNDGQVARIPDKWYRLFSHNY